MSPSVSFTVPGKAVSKSNYRHSAEGRAAGFRCERCGGGQRRLDVHHLTYERRGYELWEDLIVLCRTCHGRAHGRVAEHGGYG